MFPVEQVPLSFEGEGEGIAFEGATPLQLVSDTDELSHLNFGEEG